MLQKEKMLPPFFFSICILELKENEIKLTLSVFLPGCKVTGSIYSRTGTYIILIPWEPLEVIK